MGLFFSILSGMGVSQLRPWVRRQRLIARIRRSQLFDRAYYLATYPDVAQANIDPLAHFLDYGAAEGRNPNPLFHTAYYLAQYPDVARSGMNPLEHFIRRGAAERRNPNGLFYTGYYLARNPDVAEAGVNPLHHFMTYGWIEERNPNPLFHVRYYLQHGYDVAQAGVNPLQHYFEHGVKECRNPHPLFRTAYYLTQYPRVAQSGMNPLEYFLTYGLSAGHNPAPFFQTKFYLEQNPDVARSRLNPVDHFFRFGAVEQRPPRALSPFTVSVVQSAHGEAVIQTKKQTYTAQAEAALQQFLRSGERLILPRATCPILSIVIILHNRAELTYLCLKSLAEQDYSAIQVILVDNASSDDTLALLDQVDGATILKNADNLHFLKGVNQATEVAEGDYLLLLNNDALVLPSTLETALKTLQSSADIGAVGGKILLLDGSLQEAGSIIWQDGSCCGYGRGADPQAPQYNFRRDVDYCSGAFLLTPRQLFFELGKFDLDYAPAYYEETDYCARVWQAGYRIVYDPQVVIQHYEFGSSKTSQTALDLQAAHQQIFQQKQAHWLQHQYPPLPHHWPMARHHRQPKRLLYIDERIPFPWLGAGFPRAHKILKSLVQLGYAVTFYAMDSRLDQDQTWETIYAQMPPDVEVIYGKDYGADFLECFLLSQAHSFTTILVSRPNLMAIFNRFYRSYPDRFENVRIIYDAESICGEREMALRRWMGETITPADEAFLLKLEIDVAQTAHTILSVSEAERQRLLDYGYKHVFRVGHALAANPSVAAFDQRQDLLFVGACHHEKTPNADSLVWFVEEVLPRLNQQLAMPINLHIVGVVKAERVKRLAGPQVHFVGVVEDLSPYFERARLFIAPTRFAAGIPHKVHEAASRGLPMVTTSILASQVEWQDGQELLVADTPEAFATACARLYTDADLWQTLRHNALERIRHEHSEQAFIESLKAALDKSLLA